METIAHMPNVGRILKEARKKRNLTQQDLASILNKNRSYISRIENSDGNINVKTLLEIIEIGLGGKLKIEF